MAKGLIPKDVLTRDASQYTSQTVSDGKTALTGVSFGWSNYAEYGNALGDQYVTLPPLKKDATRPTPRSAGLFPGRLPLGLPGSA